jgi:ABC-type nitrate/sulfonate/bicarbonate transport system ATPase subunit
MQLECTDLDFFYPGTGKLILNRLSLSLDEPGFHAFFGPSGVGKTSLARLLCGMAGPAAGSVRTRGLDTFFYSYNLERLPGWSSVGRHLERITPPGKTEEKGALLRSFDLTGCLHQRFAQLSLGQQNRVNLIRYLVQDFDVLIMDESLANVDEMTRERILLTIKEMYPRLLFIYISHNVVEVARFCRQIWVLRDPAKTPQAVNVTGRDMRSDTPPDQEALQRTMLEIMNAV